MTRERLKNYKGIMSVVHKTKTENRWLPLYINFDEQMVKTEKTNDDDFFLTYLINPCTKNDVMDVIIRMLAM